MNELVTMKRYMYHGDGLKTKQDCIDRYEELRAYDLWDGLNFDFGTGDIENELSYGTEYYYYEKDMGILEYIILNWDAIHNSETHSKTRQNKYARNRKHKDNLLKKIDNDWYPVWHSRDELEYGKRYYRGKRSKLLKTQSNRKIRRYKGSFQKKGSGFHKVFDFWWELY